jgi:hypothetical protein
MNEQDLLNSIYRKFQTTMIGALARFEDNFGDLWDDDSEEADRFAAIWEDTRNSILNNGNKQARSAINEISDYLSGGLDNRVKTKYHYKFYFDKNNNQGE